MFHRSFFSPFRLRPLALCCLSIIPLSLALAFSCDADEVKQEMTAAVAAVRPALIRIHMVTADYRQGRAAKMESAGSGVIISPEGYAVTNHHVAADAERIVCTLADRREVEAKLIGTDPLADIAVIKLTSPDGKPFPKADFGDSSKLEVGDRVFAMGCPYALSQSVTMGIISNTEMTLPEGFGEEDFTLEGEDVGSIVRWIGHDALIEPGNSGGPLVNRDGLIVGVNEISIGLAGAIPSNLAKSVAEQLIKNGKITRSWLGMDIQPLLKSSGLNEGILVSGVLDDSPAQKAGLKSGDVLLSLDGTTVTARFKEEIPIFNQFVANLPVGKAVEAKIKRDGKDMTLTLTPAERQKALDKENELRNWGICATNITYTLQKEMELPSRDGVIVSSILPSGPVGSAKPTMRDGDVVTKIGDTPVKDVAQLRTVTKQLTDGKTEAVPLLVYFDRKKNHYATVVKVGKEDTTDPGAEISKAWLPVDMQVLTRELAEALGLPDKTGVRVTQVYPGSTAAKAGLRVGDLIVKLDGDPIPAEQVGDEEVLPSLIRQYDLGSEVTLTVIRDGKNDDVKVKLQTSPKSAHDYLKYEDDDFQFVARDIAFSDRADGDVDQNQTGVYVESVAEGSWAALGSLRAGDVVTQIGGSPVNSIKDLKGKMDQIAQKKPDVVLFAVKRGIHTLFLEIRPSWPEQ